MKAVQTESAENTQQERRMSSPHKSLNERAAAEHLGLSVRTLQKRRFERQDPPYLKIGRSVRYRLEDLDAFLDAHRIDPGKGLAHE